MGKPSERARTIASRAVHEALAELLEDGDGRLAALAPSTSLIDDLGMDSFLFVDLTLALETKLGLGEFPTRLWADEEIATGGRFTIGSLIDLSAALIDAPAPGADPTGA